MQFVFIEPDSRSTQRQLDLRGVRDLVNSENIVAGVFAPVLAKHSKHFVLADAIDIWLGRMQPNFERMRKQVEGKVVRASSPTIADPATRFSPLSPSQYQAQK